MWPDAIETERLLKQIEEADPSAADELWERHRPALRRMIAFRLDPVLKQRIDASDVVQDVLLKASQKLREYLRNPVMPFHLWLGQLARDYVIDARRRHRGAKKRSLDRERHRLLTGGSEAFAERSSLELGAQLRDPALTPAALAIQVELQQRFRAALESLDGADREVILLRHFDQLSNSEAAQALGLSEAAAGMRHLRALRRLRAILAQSPSQS
jgi:RNA polymerase sigma-70 factor (ECF subfamily)